TLIPYTTLFRSFHTLTVQKIRNYVNTAIATGAGLFGQTQVGRLDWCRDEYRRTAHRIHASALRVIPAGRRRGETARRAHDRPRHPRRHLRARHRLLAAR